MLEIGLIKNENKDYTELINQINSLGQSIRLYKIIIDEHSIIESISNISIDIIIVEYNIFKKINTLNFSKLNPNLKFIIILTEKNIINNTNYNDNYLFCNINIAFQILKNYLTFNNLSNNLDKEKISIKNKIYEELKYLGYNTSYYGTQYLLDCIYYLYTKQNNYTDVSMKEVYSILSQKYKKSENTIKCNMTRATSIMFCDCEEKN